MYKCFSLKASQSTKKAARIILDKSIDTPSDELFQELNWMHIEDRIKYQKAILMYKCMNNICPSYLADSFKLTRSVHRLNLRSTDSNTLYVHKPNIELYRSSFVYSGSKIWNDLPVCVKTAKSVFEFKRKYLTSIRN